MAVSKVKKIQVIAHKSTHERILLALQETGFIAISDVKPLIQEGNTWNIFSLFKPEKGLNLDEIINELNFTRHYVSSFEPEKSKVIHNRYNVKKDEFTKVFESFDYKDTYKRCVDTEYNLKEIDSVVSEINSQISELHGWQGLNVPLSQIHPTHNTDIFLGVIDVKLFDGLVKELDSKNLLYCIKVISEDTAKKRKFILFMCHKAHSQNIDEILKRFDFKHTYFPNLKDTPANEIDLTKKRLQELKAQKDLHIKGIQDIFAKEHRQLSILYDHLYNLRARLNAQALLGQTHTTILINGWIKKNDIKALEKAISNFPEADVIISDPAKDDIIPVDLENPKVVEPFEFITRIYGLPKYGELDATPFLAPFFFIFFGFCVTDAGYGLVMALISIFALLKFRHAGKMAKLFFKLLLLGGLSTLVLGALTGGWFGNLIDVLAQKNTFFLIAQKIKNMIIMLDPNKDPLKLLMVALGLGVIQIWWGHVAAIIGNIKNRRFLDIIFDQGSILTFLFGFTGLILTLGGLFKEMAGFFKYAAIAGSFFIILTQGRNEKDIGGKIFNGVFALYSTASGYLSDVLSYCRLWALGLVTGVMAMTCNLIGFLIGDMIPVVGFIVTFMILAVGHLFTIAINILGALVHSARLQFVEFFPKFYKSGGAAFTPLKVENKYTVVE